MTDIVKTLLEVLVGTGATAVLVRQVVKQAITHFLDIQRLSFTAELKHAAKAQEAELQLWSGRQRELIRHLIEGKAVAIQQLVNSASVLRRAIHGIGEERDGERLRRLYRGYWERFYADPILPKKLFEAAHSFRQVAETVIGACLIAGATDPLAGELARQLDDSYIHLVDEARVLLLPEPDRGAAPGTLSHT